MRTNNMEEYNPKNPDLYKQVELPPPTPPSLNIVPLAQNQSTLNEGAFLSKNFRTGRSGFRMEAGGTFEARNGIFSGTFSIGGTQITVGNVDAVQEALDKVYVEGGGTVFLQVGTYLLTDNIFIPTGVALEGVSRDGVIINCNGSYAVYITGEDVYNTGTVTINNGATTLVGSSTAWTSALVGRYVLLDGLWYKITAFGSSTSLTISTYQGDNLAGSAYVLATTNFTTALNKVTLTGATGSGIIVQYAMEPTLFDVVVYGCGTGIEMDYVTYPRIVVTCNENGVNMNLNFVEGFIIDFSEFNYSTTGNGITMNEARNATFFNSSVNDNTGDGINMTSCDTIAFISFDISGNGGQGIEEVSGCNDNQFTNGLVNGNTSDGIKLTATTDRNTFTAISLTNNGGYGINIAASTCDNNQIIAPAFNGNVSGTINDSGTGTFISPENTIGGLTVTSNWYKLNIPWLSALWTVEDTMVSDFNYTSCIADQSATGGAAGAVLESGELHPSKPTFAKDMIAKFALTTRAITTGSTHGAGIGFYKTNGKVITAVGNAQIDTAQSKFGGASGLFDGTGDYLTTPDHAAWAFGTGKFTIDCWVRTPSLDSNAIVGQVTDATNFWGFIFNSSADTISFGSITAGAWDVNFSIPATIVADTWYHVAVVRNGSTSATWHMFLDGVEGVKTLAAGAYTGTIFDSASTLNVGSLSGNFANDMDGWIDELRIVKGTAVWTANFTPPTSAYTGDTSVGTELLLHMDGTDASTTFTDSNPDTTISTTTLKELCQAPVPNTTGRDGILFFITEAGALIARTVTAGVETDTTITGVTITDSNIYMIAWEAAVAARFYVNGTLKATITTNLPTSTGTALFGFGKGGNVDYGFSRIGAIDLWIEN